MSKPFRYRDCSGTEIIVAADMVERIQKSEDGTAALQISNQLVRTAEPFEYVRAQLLGVGRYFDL